MPTYEYKCTNCGNHFEIFQSIKDEPLKWCSECGNDTLKKLISLPAGLIFKGSGFYLTDYKKSSEKKDTIKHTAKPDKDKKAESKQPKTKGKKQNKES